MTGSRCEGTRSVVSLGDCDTGVVGLNGRQGIGVQGQRDGLEREKSSEGFIDATGKHGRRGTTDRFRSRTVSSH